jgi:hypothetical protein
MNCELSGISPTVAGGATINRVAASAPPSALNLNQQYAPLIKEKNPL